MVLTPIIQKYRGTGLFEVDSRQVQTDELNRLHRRIWEMKAKLKGKTLETAGVTHDLIDQLDQKHQFLDNTMKELYFLQGVAHVFQLMSHLYDDGVDLLRHQQSLSG